MKVSIKQLELVISKMKYSMLGYSSKDDKDVDVEISLTKEDPGSGSMVDCLTLTATKPREENEESEVTMSVEVYPSSEKVEPRGSKTESFPIKKSY